MLGIISPVAAGAAFAQESQPYAGWQARPIKALSEQDIADLRAGEGMGLALAAELNGYPGPRHVIDLSAPLQLTDAQRAEVAALFAAMQAEAVPLGEKLIAAEADLERLFAERKVTLASLEAATAAIGATESALRAAHLKYHISTAAVLTPAQIARYQELRGYAGAGAHQHGGHSGGH
jgi:Spy/CpxP family protein refolding chaperone